MGSDMQSQTPKNTPELGELKVEDKDGLYSLDNYQICESLGYLFKRTMAMIANAIDQELASFDLTHQQFSILMMLTQHRCYTAADLARETGVDTGAITRILDRLEAKGIVRRVRSSADRRVVNIELTDSGAFAAQKMPVVAINVLNRHLVGFERDELEAMKSMLRRILRNGGVVIGASREESVNTSGKGD